MVTAAGVIRLTGPMFARSLAGRSLATTNLAVISTQSWFAAALVDSFALSIVQAGDNTLGKFTPQSVVSLRAFAFIFLDTLSSIQALFRADSSFAVSSLVTWWTGAVPRCGAVASVHALRIAQGRLAVLAHVSLRAEADLVLIADALVGALFVTLWIGSLRRC